MAIDYEVSLTDRISMPTFEGPARPDKGNAAQFGRTSRSWPRINLSSRPTIRARRDQGRLLMPLRFQRRLRIAPGISVNLNRRSISASFGRRGSHVTLGPKGTRNTVGLPRTGLYYTTFHQRRPSTLLIVAIVIIVLLAVLFRL